jgi:hypothetical protein
VAGVTVGGTAVAVGVAVGDGDGLACGWVEMVTLLSPLKRK